MPDLTGIELLKTLRIKPVVVFTTAYQEYALDGFNLDVVDYLLKPISFDRFVQGVQKAIDLIQTGTRHKTEDQAQAISQQTDSINLKSDARIFRVKFDDILFIEGLKEYVTFYTTKRKIVVLESLKNLEETLPATKFRRVHKSYIVNTEKIGSLYGNQIEIGDHKIPIGKSYAEKIKRALFRLQ